MAIMAMSAAPWPVVLLLLVSLPATAQDGDAAVQLQQMSQALRSLDYQGSFLYQAGARIDTLRVFHAAGAVERERILSLSGPRSEVLRSGDAITLLKGDSAASRFSSGAASRLIPLIPEWGPTLPESYTLRTADADRVAGYDTLVIDIVPRDRMRYGYRLWLEHASRLPLRVALIGAEQRPIEQIMFVSLSIGNTPSDGDLAANAAPEGVQPALAEIALPGTARWHVDPLPDGFRLTGRHAPAQAASTGAEHLIYGDGLATVSVYVEPSTEPVEDDVALSRGAMNVYIHRVDGWRYTALGNVPAATVQYFATTLQRTATDSAR